MGKLQIYKNDKIFTEDQRKKLDKLHKMGWNDVVRAYMKTCLQENYTDEFKLKLELGLLEGVGIDLDEEYRQATDSGQYKK